MWEHLIISHRRPQPQAMPLTTVDQTEPDGYLSVQWLCGPSPCYFALPMLRSIVAPYVIHIHNSHTVLEVIRCRAVSRGAAQ
jgi:hypothetical protein